MTCDQIREQLVETARGRELSSDLRAIVFSHAAECGGCARRLEAEQSLSRNLERLAGNAEGAPARMAEMIWKKAPVTSIRPLRQQPASWKTAMWTGVAACAACVGLLVWNGGRPASSVPLPALQRVGTRTAASVEKAVASAPSALVGTAVHRRKAAVREAGDVGAEPFLPIPYADEVPPEEPTEVLRVQVPRESLAMLGLPESADGSGDVVSAEVLVGMDGTARAIRLMN